MTATRRPPSLVRLFLGCCLFLVAINCFAQYGAVVLKDGRLVPIFGRAQIIDDDVVFTYKNGNLMKLPLARVDLQSTRDYERRWAHLIDKESGEAREKVIPPEEDAQEVSEEALATLVERYNAQQQSQRGDSPRRTLVYTGREHDGTRTDDETPGEDTQVLPPIPEGAEELVELSQDLYKKISQHMEKFLWLTVALLIIGAITFLISFITQIVIVVKAYQEHLLWGLALTFCWIAPYSAIFTGNELAMLAAGIINLMLPILTFIFIMMFCYGSRLRLLMLWLCPLAWGAVFVGAIVLVGLLG